MNPLQKSARVFLNVLQIKDPSYRWKVRFTTTLAIIANVPKSCPRPSPWDLKRNVVGDVLDGAVLELLIDRPIRDLGVAPAIVIYGFVATTASVQMTLS